VFATENVPQKRVPTASDIDLVDLVIACSAKDVLTLRFVLSHVCASLAKTFGCVISVTALVILTIY
jgi:hypothetical protein